jgi:hypothetical protein
LDNKAYDIIDARCNHEVPGITFLFNPLSLALDGKEFGHKGGFCELIDKV